MGDEPKIAAEDVTVTVVPKPAPKAKPAPAPKPKKDTTTVTPSADLRVVTEDFVVVYLKAGEPRELGEELLMAARILAVKKGVDLKTDE